MAKMTTLRPTHASLAFHRTIASAALLLTSLLAVPSCSKTPPEPVVDVTYNPQRIKRSIPILPPDWVRDFDYKMIPHCQNWNPPVKAPGTPRHLWKIMYFEDGLINFESDCYVSGEKFEYTDADDRHEVCDVSIVTRYSYEDERAGRNPWSFSYSESMFAKDISRTEANRLLTSWHLPAI